MKAWLVTLRILPDQPGGIWKLAEETVLRGPILLHEQAVQFCIEGVAAAQKLYKSRRVVLNVEGVYPGVDFSKVVPSSLSSPQLWIEAGDPVAVSAFRSHQSNAGVEDVSIAIR